VGLDGIILRANTAQLQLLGYPPRSTFPPPAEFHVRRTRYDSQSGFHGESPRLPVDLRIKDGSIKHVLIHSNVLWDGKFVHTRCFIRDITTRTQDEFLRSS
jgi:PAS domain-containing protein